MQAILSHRTVNQAQAQVKKYDIHDTRLPGFILRVQPSGHKTYYVNYARARWIKIGHPGALTPEQARDKARTILAEAQLGGDPVNARKAAKARTFAQYIREVYAPWFEAHRRTGKMTVGYLLSRFPDLADQKLADITAWQVEKWRAQRLKQVKPTTANRELVTLKAALNKAVEWKLLENHPLAKVKPIKVNHLGRIRYLNADEERGLRAALAERENRYRDERDQGNAWRRARGYAVLPDLRDGYVDHLQPLVLLSINTGLRRGELFNLKREHVDLERRILTVAGDTQGNKTIEARYIPLNQEAHAVLTTWIQQRQPVVWIFPGQQGARLDNISSSWERVRRTAALVDFRWHDLRHTFASKLVMAGVDLNTVRELLGHTSLDMTLRYAHLAPEHKAAAVGKLDAPARDISQTTKDAA
ncbi:MAG: site-specific integrase [Candidatus Competibacteraceae bacterium]|nr:site-specific integrase [Candidatus Competibacteraceae bacterium]